MENPVLPAQIMMFRGLSIKPTKADLLAHFRWNLRLKEVFHLFVVGRSNLFEIPGV
jgi:hypothetical protein